MTNNICDIEYSLQLMIKIMEQTNLKRNSIHRGKKKMGIMNLGCICYINAVLQQLEMIEPFRKGIIGTEVVGDTIDFFREFQHIIYQLTFGQRIFLIPESFCLNYLDSNNMPINIREQHDADEFLNQLFDRLEFRLKDTNQGHLINNNFKGELVNVINC
jgi:ubiquitin C-terminal hydrolase